MQKTLGGHCNVADSVATSGITVGVGKYYHEKRIILELEIFDHNA